MEQEADEYLIMLQMNLSEAMSLYHKEIEPMNKMSFQLYNTGRVMKWHMDKDGNITDMGKWKPESKKLVDELELCRRQAYMSIVWPHLKKLQEYQI